MKRRRALPAIIIVLAVCLAGLVLWRWQGIVLSTPPAMREPPPQFAQMSPGGNWRPAKLAIRKKAIASILGQLQAFRKGDYEKAVLYQSNALRLNFRSADQFGDMIQRGYPEFAHYQSVQFGPAFADPSGRLVIVPVTLIGQDRVTVHAEYQMILEGKRYHVNGVMGGVRPTLLHGHGKSV